MRTLFRSLVVVLFGWTLIDAVGAEVPSAEDFTRDAQDASSRPIVVMFSADHCPFCETVRRYYLGPLVDDPAYRHKMLVRLVELESDAPLVDFQGKHLDHFRFADMQQVSFVPTIRFFDTQGQRIAPDLVGLGLEDFYLDYLRDGIERAWVHMQERHAVRSDPD